MRPDVSICLLTWNRSDFLEICLQKLFEALTPTKDGGLSREIVIMDNGSTDGTADVLRKYEAYPDVRIVRNKTNLRFNAYKKLFFMARGNVLIDLDDDILGFPKDFDKTLVEYLGVYKDYGFLACNVIQDEKTNGAKPVNYPYKEDVRGDKVVEEGPTGGWCSAFRRKDYRWIKWLIFFFKITISNGEDAFLAAMCRRLHKRMGIIKNAVCFHACGPYYAKKFNHLDREIEKYTVDGGIPEIAAQYEAQKVK